VYFTDRGIEELVEWLAARMRTFVDEHPEFEDAVERLATFLARDDTDEPDDLSV
jgi:hypothetical protein